MSNLLFHAIDRPGPSATGWLVSCLLHGSLAVASMLFVQRLELAPEAEPFQWNVTMVTSSATEPPSPAESSVLPIESKTESARELQQPTPPIPAPPQGLEPSQPRVETLTPPSPPPVTASADQPALITPTASPSIAEFPPPLPYAHTASPKPMGQTNQVVIHSEAIASVMRSIAPPSPLAQAIPPAQSMNAPPAAPSRESTPAEPADPSPKEEHPSQTPFPTGADQLSSIRKDAVPPSKESETSPRPSAPAGSLAAAPAAQSQPAKIDYGWLATLMGRWIEDLDKRYPAMLRIEGIQGKVTLTALLHEDGILSDVRVAKSSGNTMLDQVAVEDVRKGSPITLSRPLERRHMPVKFSIIYDLKTAR